MQKIASRWKCLCFRRCPNKRFALITMLIAQGEGQNLGHLIRLQTLSFPKGNITRLLFLFKKNVAYTLSSRKSEENLIFCSVSSSPRTHLNCTIGRKKVSRHKTTCESIFLIL